MPPLHYTAPVRALSFLAVSAGLLLVRAASAAPLVIDGEVPEGGPDHFYVPFEVPEGTVEIEVRHDDLSADDILDWGLDDPSGFRGWGGGNGEPAVVGVEAASRSYLPGPLPAGTWNVVVGKAKIQSKPARYHLEIELRTAPTLPNVPRKPWVAPAPLETTARWYAGDFHVHSRESGDARPSIDEIAAFAKERGLDFVELSDHNTVSQLDFMVDAQAKSKVLLIPGIEYTTYAGHANAIGATSWVNHRIGLPEASGGATIEQAVKSVHDQGALFSINHPGLDLGDMCIGCAWEHELPADRIDAVEIETGALDPVGFLFHPLAIQFWEKLLAEGAHVAAIGGSDDHRAGKDLVGTQSAIGSPTTMVFARELSVAAILEGIKNGRTVVKLQGPDDPMVELLTDVAPVSDTVADEFVVLRAKVTGGGEGVRFVKNGAPLAEVPVSGEGFVHELIVDAPATGEDRYRAEVIVDGRPRTITSHVFVKHQATGRPRPTAAEPASSGCGCDVPGGARAGASAIALAILTGAGAVAIARRRRRAADSGPRS